MAASMGVSLLVGSSRKYNKSLFYFYISLCLFSICSAAIMLYHGVPSNFINEPVKTLEIWCLSYAFLQCCGYWLLNSIAAAEESSGKNTRGGSALYIFTSTTKTLLRYGLLLFLSCISFHLIAVLYGAPLTQTVEETAVFGVLMTTLVTVPLLCILGTDGDKYHNIVGNRSPHPGLETCLVYLAFFSLLGGWLGAFPIPLDWDRPWQKWPVSCSIGAIFGHIIGLAASVVHSGRNLGEGSEMLFSRSKSKNY